MAFRRTARLVHKWVGLVLAGYFLLQALSGIMLVYREDIVAAFTRDSYDELAGQPDVLARAIGLLSRDRPGWRLDRIDFPTDPAKPLLARVTSSAGERAHVELRPVGNAAPEIATVGAFLNLVFDFHATLFTSAGKYVVGTAGLFLLISSVTGLMAWWPGAARIARSLRITFAGNRIRLCFELHRSIGALAALLILLSAATGMLLALGGLLRPMLLPAPEVPAGTALSPDVLLERARQALPGMAVRNVRFRQPGNAVHRVGFFTSEARLPAPTHQVWLNPVTGEILRVEDARRHTPAEAFFAWQYPLHTGVAVGKIGRLLTIATGLALALLAVTGPLTWLFRRTKRAAGVASQARANVATQVVA